MFYQRLALLCFALITLPSPALADVDNTQLAVWANEAIVSTYTYNYQNYLQRQKDIAVYFNSKAWIKYTKALIDSKLPDDVKKNNYYVNAVATWPPTIKSISTDSWQATMPLLVVYKNPQYQQKQTLEVTLEFTAAPQGQGVRGFMITNFQAKVIQPVCQCGADSCSVAKPPK